MIEEVTLHLRLRVCAHPRCDKSRYSWPYCRLLRRARQEEPQGTGQRQPRTGQGLYFCASTAPASCSIFRSSPLLYISIIVSQPPTNSPSM